MTGVVLVTTLVLGGLALRLLAMWALVTGMFGELPAPPAPPPAPVRDSLWRDHGEWECVNSNCPIHHDALYPLVNRIEW